MPLGNRTRKTVQTEFSSNLNTKKLSDCESNQSSIVSWLKSRANISTSQTSLLKPQTFTERGIMSFPCCYDTLCVIYSAQGFLLMFPVTVWNMETRLWWWVETPACLWLGIRDSLLWWIRAKHSVTCSLHTPHQRLNVVLLHMKWWWWYGVRFSSAAVNKKRFEYILFTIFIVCGIRSHLRSHPGGGSFLCPLKKAFFFQNSFFIWFFKK